MSDATGTAGGYRDNAHDAHGHDDGKVHVHIASVKFYVAILGALMFLTALTVGISYVHLGPLNLAVAILIASIKASLVLAFFMHLRHDTKFNSLIFVCSLLFIGVFFAYTFNDTGRRGEVDEATGTQVLPSTGKEAPGGYEKPALHHADGTHTPGEHSDKAHAPDHPAGNESNGSPQLKPAEGAPGHDPKTTH